MHGPILGTEERYAWKRELSCFQGQHLPDGAAFVDAAALGAFVRRVLASTNDAFVINGESFVDASVYSRNRCFRLCGSSKKTKRAPLVVVGDGRLASEDALPEASLVVPVAAPSRLLGSHDAYLFH